MNEIMHCNLSMIAGGCSGQKISESCVIALEYAKANAANYSNPVKTGAAWLLEGGCCKGDLLYAKNHLVTDDNEYVLLALSAYDAT